MKVIVVGAGLAYAKVLTQRGRKVTVFEASDGVGGRVRTDALGGFLLDRGFQVYFAACPAPKRQLGMWRAVPLGGFDLRDEEIYRRGVEDVSRWYPEAGLEPLAIYRVPYARFSQPPGVQEELPKNRTDTPALAGEYAEDSSINGSTLSDEKAAEEAMRV